MRDYREMPIHKDNNKLLALPIAEPREWAVFKFAFLAYQLGLKSEQILHIVQHSPDKELAENTLQKARDPNDYEYNNFDACRDGIMAFFKYTRIKPREGYTETSLADKLPRRYRVPSIYDYKSNK